MKEVKRSGNLLGMGVAVAMLLGQTAFGAAAERGGATNEIGGLKGVKLVETEHYRIYYLGESPVKFKGLIEKIWAESAKVLPRLDAIAKTGEPNAEPPAQEEKDEKAKARPPTISPTKVAGPKGQAESPNAFKLTLIFAERRSDYETAARSLLPPNLPANLRQQAEAAIQTAPTVTQDNRTRVYWTGDPNMKTKGYEVFMCHAGAAQCSGSPPRWQFFRWRLSSCSTSSRCLSI